MDFNAESARRTLWQMLRIRRFEEKCAELYSAGKIRGFLHLYIGEEAVATGVMPALRPDDAILATYREHGHALARGLSMRAIMAEMYGKQEGCSRGRGGSMHLFDVAMRFYGGNAIVAGGLPMAVGFGLADKLQGSDRVTACFFGEGAVAEGEFHESANLASLWHLPVLFVCENNMYATEVALSYATKNQNLAERAGTAYQMPSFAIDGNDVLAVYNTAGEAIRRARAGGGPTFIECKTYRTRAHAEGMRDAGYRTQEEVESWKQRDPIANFKTKLLSDGIATQDDLDSIDNEIKAMVEEGLEFAKNSPYPDPATVTEYIYSS